ncbi:HNH endonuclease [Curvivirga sp.]|uniref:HNH endonuclease n=1 Tax=Curvivirga sp. TaxID=2856848 RepID=UPI003B58D8E5
MKLKVDFSRLIQARESIGAKAAPFIKTTSRRLPQKSAFELELIETGNVILLGEDLERLLEFPAGLATIGNTQATLHIYQPFTDLETLQSEPSPAPKYHVMDCDILRKMKQKGRFDRYVLTRDPEGLFRVEPWDRERNKRLEEINAQLMPCKVCLKELNYDGFAEKEKSQTDEIVKNFDIGKFFENYEHIFRSLPLYSPETFPEGNYTSDWAKISENVRRAAQWKCDKCGVELSKHRSLLHVHHKDGNRGNNNKFNLQPLCCICHKDQAFHENMYIKPDHIQTIKKLRETS